jgi:hypothetical protein
MNLPRVIVSFCMERYGQELMPVPTEVSSFMFFERRFFGGKLR